MFLHNRLFNWQNLLNVFLIGSSFLFALIISMEPWNTINDSFVSRYFGSECFPWNYKTQELYIWTTIPNIALFWGIFVCGLLSLYNHPKVAKLLLSLPWILLFFSLATSFFSGGNDCG